jgi:hypothetical protein
MSESEYKEKENKKDTLIITIGRMNPPTPGHMGLIKKMIENAIELEQKNEKTHVAIILSHSQGNETDSQGYNKNPLNCKEYKRDLVKNIIVNLKKQMIKENEKNSEYIEKIVPEVMCMDDEPKPNMYSSIGSLVRNYKPNKMFLVVGQDRDEDYKGIQKYYENVKIEIITLERPDNAMSATEIRNYVKADDKQKFMEKMYPLGLSDERFEELYDMLKEELKEPIGKPNSKIAKPKTTVKKSTETRKRKIRDGEDKPNVGGMRKSRKIKINKKTRKNKNNKNNNNSKNKNKSKNKKRIQ